MKILFTRFPYESSYGGAEVQTLSLMQGLRERGHAVAFLGSCPVLLRLCKEKGIPHAKLDIGKPPVSKGSALSFTWRKGRMDRLLQTALRQFDELDAICMLSLTEKILLTPHVAERNIPVVWIEHDKVGKWLTQNPWLPKLKALSKIAKTVCVSDLSKDVYVSLGWERKNIISIPNGVHTTDIAHRKTDALRLQIGCIARLSYEKGVDVLIRAMKDVPTAALSILGKGPEQKNLEKLVRKLQLTERVAFKETLANIDDLYQEIDLLVLPSRAHDPFGMVAAEAMMRGIPVIVTEACGIARHVKRGSEAIVIPVNSVEALTEAIKTLTPEKRKILSEQGRQAAREKFTLKTMIDRYEQLLS